MDSPPTYGDCDGPYMPRIVACMNIFISWSGERAKAAAIALSDWLPSCLQSVTSFVSPRDIQSGDRWAQVLSKQLEITEYGIFCLTRSNLREPWLLFEAGAISKSREGRAYTFLLDDLKATDIEFPLAQFQHTQANQDDTLKLLKDINNSCEQKVAPDRLSNIYNALWPGLKKSLDEIP